MKNQWSDYRAFSREDAIWKFGALYFKVCSYSVEKQQATVKFLEEKFNVNIDDLLHNKKSNPA